MFNTGFPKRWSTLRKLLCLRIMQGAAAVLQTVTGNAPLTLANAVARAIKSLTQTGLCTQADTPTPSAPVDIKCNNGVLKLVDDELPAGFKRLESIKFDGDCWYKTGEVMTGDDDVTMTLDGTSTTGQNVFGSYNGTSSGTKNFSLFIYGDGSSSNCYLRYGGQLLRPRFGSGERTITFGKSGTSGFYTDVTAEPDTFTTVAGAFIGMLPNSSSPAYTGTIVGDITVGTRLKWIPCERTADGVVGYYEAVNGKFIEPSGTGSATKGAYDYTHAHLAVVGTPEVLTVSASGAADQTASVADLLSVGDSKDEHEIIHGVVKRKVGTYVFDGSETFGSSSAYGTALYINAFASRIGADRSVSPLCTHFVGGESSGQQPEGTVFFNASGHCYFRVTDSASDFKAFLKGQYDAGIPVILVFALTPGSQTTESVAGQALHTVAGTNTVSVTAEVSPVALSCEYYQAAA